MTEKSALFSETIKNEGTLFINNDDSLLTSANKKYKKRITFGLEKKSDVKGEIIDYTKDGKPIVGINYKGKSSTFEVPLYGEQSAKNFLTAAAIAYKVGLKSEEIKKRLGKIQSVDKRLNVERFKNFILINDTYNANPESMEMSLQLLSKIHRYEKRIAILGDMFELGKESKVLHERLSSVIVRNKINSVYTIGNMMKHLYSNLKSKRIDSIHFKDRDSLNNFLRKSNFKNTVVLVKGSRGMKMEEFVQTIKAVNN